MPGCVAGEVESGVGAFSGGGHGRGVAGERHNTGKEDRGVGDREAGEGGAVGEGVEGEVGEGGEEVEVEGELGFGGHGNGGGSCSGDSMGMKRRGRKSRGVGGEERWWLWFARVVGDSGDASGDRDVRGCM